MDDLEAASFKNASRRARELEGELDKLLASPKQQDFSRIEGSLSELKECVSTMEAYVDKHSTMTHVALARRYRDALIDFDADYKRASVKARQDREREQLLKGAKTAEDDDEEDLEGGTGGLDPLMRERKSIGSALRGVEDTLTQGAEAREMLARQRQTLVGSNLTVAGLVEKLPNVNDVIAAMQRQQTRHNVIVATTIGGCACFLIWGAFLA